MLYQLTKHIKLVYLLYSQSFICWAYESSVLNLPGQEGKHNSFSCNLQIGRPCSSHFTLFRNNLLNILEHIHGL
jgi:hypothetical protein